MTSAKYSDSDEYPSERHRFSSASPVCSDTVVRTCLVRLPNGEPFPERENAGRSGKDLSSLLERRNGPVHISEVLGQLMQAMELARLNVSQHTNSLQKLSGNS